MIALITVFPCFPRSVDIPESESPVTTSQGLHHALLGVALETGARIRAAEKLLGLNTVGLHGAAKQQQRERELK